MKIMNYVMQRLLKQLNYNYLTFTEAVDTYNIYHKT